MPHAPPHQQLSYRPDIDGLRAVAVLAVVVHHTFPRLLHGGFIGVDVFFVISGFLISTILFKDAERGTLSYRDFYVRRVQRIFPALLVVLAVCFGFACLFGFPKDAWLIGKHILGGATFSSNFILWNEAGYFDSTSELKPLLHLWSLSVEEQYYIFWPLIVAALLSRRRSFFVALMFILLIGSFALNVTLVKRDPVMTFYWPTTRMWELLIGSLLAYLTLFHRGSLTRTVERWAPSSVNLGQRLPDALSWVGMASLLVSFAVTRESAAFPGWWALGPTLGTACLLAAGPAANWNRRLLSTAPMVFVGKISYPLYLWHWPLLAFPKVLNGTASHLVRAAAVLLSVALAWLTYRFLEKPVRFGLQRRVTPWALAGALLLLGAGGGWLFATDGLPGRFPPDLRQIATAEFTFDTRLWRADRCFLNPAQTASDFAEDCLHPKGDAALTVWLWGDSHAAAIYPGLLEVLSGDGHYRLAQTTASACPPVLDLYFPLRPNCRSINDAVLNGIVRQAPHTVILAGNWFNGQDGAPVDLGRLAQTVARLKVAGVGRVVLIGSFLRWNASLPTVIMRSWRRNGSLPTDSLESVETGVFAADDAVRRVAADSGALFVSPIRAFCTGNGCRSVFSEQGSIYPVAWDESHLSKAASVLFAKEIKAQSLSSR